MSGETVTPTASTTPTPPKPPKGVPGPADRLSELQHKAFLKGTYKRSGRPVECELTQALQEEIIMYILSGAYIETAVAAAGVSKPLFYKWLRRGKAYQKAGGKPRGDLKFSLLVDAVKEAVARAELKDIAVIAKASTISWQAAAWRLERRAYKRWGQKSHLSLEGGETPLKIQGDLGPQLDLDKLTNEEYEAYKALVKKASPVHSTPAPEVAEQAEPEEDEIDLESEYDE